MVSGVVSSYCIPVYLLKIPAYCGPIVVNSIDMTISHSTISIHLALTEIKLKCCIPSIAIVCLRCEHFNVGIKTSCVLFAQPVMAKKRVNGQK